MEKYEMTPEQVYIFFLEKLFMNINHYLTQMKAKNKFNRNRGHKMLILSILAILTFPFIILAQEHPEDLLPDGSSFVSWEVPVKFTRTYYVDNQDPEASDQNEGSAEAPFKTINKAAQVLMPGERVIIKTGVYREKVMPQRGGDGPARMISYEAAEGASVVVKGSRLIKSGWEPSTGFRYEKPDDASAPVRIYQFDMENLELNGYNPFGLSNVMMDKTYLKPKSDELLPHLLRRGMVFVDGIRLTQVEMYRDLAQKDGTFWSEHNGMVVHVRLPNDANPADHEVELTVQEQVFAPKKSYLSFIRIKGITFEHAASGFPVPQRGLVSASKGHHWIIEDCIIRHANSVALDIGNQDWNASSPPVNGYMIVRKNHISDAGICGLAGMHVVNTLIEDNLIERIGWHDAELAWESGGIKLHETENCLLRNNIIRYLTFAPGIWLDYANMNTRVTKNVIGDIKQTIRGGIYLEASQYQNMLDHNIIWDITRGKGGSDWNINDDGGWGIIIDGSDETVVAHNLIGKCEWAALKTRTVEGRIVETRGGTSCRTSVINNIFFDSGKSIYFSHKDNMAEGNFYALQGRSRGRGLNWIHGYEIIRVDLPAWQKYYGFDKNGSAGNCSIEVDLDKLTLQFTSKDGIPISETQKIFSNDFLNASAGNQRFAGPFHKFEANQILNINPLHK